NTTLVSPIEVDNTAPTITLGTVSDDQATNGTLTISYVTDPDVVRVDFTYFHGTWNSIGSDTSVDGTFTWTPSGPIENVMVRSAATRSRSASWLTVASARNTSISHVRSSAKSKTNLRTQSSSAWRRPVRKRPGSKRHRRNSTSEASESRPGAASWTQFKSRRT